jgi:hypothetical protein
MTQTYWHVTGPDYQPGDDLMCWDMLVDRGIAPEWKWDEADEGTDGHMVCLFADDERGRRERDWLADDIAGAQILRIEIDQDDERIEWTRASYESYAAVVGSIPGDLIEIV